MSFLLGQTPAFATTAPPPLSWGYLDKIGTGYNYTGQVIGVDYKIYSSVPFSEISNLVVTLQTNHAAGPVTCVQSATEIAYICSVRHTIVQADITRNFVSLDASFTAKHNGIDVNGFIYTSTPAGSNNGSASSTSPNFAYFPPAPVYTPQTITHNVPSGTVSLDAGTLAVSMSSTSGIGVTATTANLYVCSISSENGVVTGINLGSAGTCEVNITAYGGSTNGLDYSAAFEKVTFTISKATNTITFAQPADQAIGSGPLIVAPTASASFYGVPVGIFTSTPATCNPTTSTSGRITLLAVGTCTLQAYHGGDQNFEAAANVTRSFQITRAANVITVDSISPKTTLDADFQLTASASSNLAVSFSTTTPSVCSVSGDTVDVLAVGQCSINANQSGDITYAAAATVTQSFTVSQPPNAITFSAIAYKTFGDAPFVISASATSNLPVTVSSNSPTVCTVSGATVTLVAAGQCQLLGKQAGDAIYPAAADETASFAVNKAATTATLDTINGPVFATQTITLTARVTGQSPTGSVEFFVDKSSFAIVTLSNGVATTTYTTTRDGDHTFGIAYSGDTNNQSTGSKGQRITVDARPADASQSASTRSGIQAQNQATQRYAASQNNNVSTRLQNTRNPDTENSFALQLQLEGAPQVAGLAAAGQQMTGFGKGNLPFGMWVGGTVGFGSQDNSTSGEDKFHTSGLTIGFDHRVSDALLLGVALGIAADETKIGTDGSKVEGDNFSGSLYASYRTAPTSYIDLLVGYGAGDLQTARYDTLGAIMLHGDRDTSQFFGSLAFTYEKKIDHLTFAPYLKARAEHTSADAYAETGSPIWALAYDDMSSTSVNAVAGFDARFDIPVSWGTLVATGGAEYSTQVAGNYKQGVGYADGAGGAFTITDAGTSASQFTTSAGLAATVDQLTLDVLYKYSLANHDAKSHAISGTVRYEF